MDAKSVLTNPAVVHANHFQFGPGEIVGPRIVASKMVLWNIDGEGRLYVDGVRHLLEPERVFVIPWKRVSKIVSSASHPLHVGGAHIVPSVENENPVIWRAAHDKGDPLFDSKNRVDVPWSTSTTSTISITGPAARDIRALGEIAIHRFNEGDTSLEVMRSLAILMVSLLISPPHEVSRSVPRTLQSAQDYCLAHFESPISNEFLSQFVGISKSALSRQFVAHTGDPPQRWLRTHRLKLAAKLLHTTTLRVGEVARRVGFSDPLHFSRVFSSEYGVCPREYSKSRPLF